MHTLLSVFVNSPPPKPEVILTNFFAEPTVLLMPIASRELHSHPEIYIIKKTKLSNRRFKPLASQHGVQQQVSRNILCFTTNAMFVKIKLISLLTVKLWIKKNNNSKINISTSHWLRWKYWYLIRLHKLKSAMTRFIY